MKKKAIVLFSGGIDSTVLLFWAKRRFDVLALSFTFPGRRKMEIRAMKNILRYSATPSWVVDLPFVARPEAKKSCFIPQRNLMYYGTAASCAATYGASVILGGHIRHDAEVFADARPQFFKRLEKLINSITKKKIALSFPLHRWSKKQVIAAGKILAVPFHLTYSCSRDGKRHCGDCGSCRERQLGFRAAGMRDPLHHPR